MLVSKNNQGLYDPAFEHDACGIGFVANIKQTLYQRGAVYASMSGTGSTVYGFFPTSIIDTLDFNFPAHYFVATAS